MEGKDVLATAQTGTGKTLAFLIPVMEKLVQRNAPGIGALRSEERRVGKEC